MIGLEMERWGNRQLERVSDATAMCHGAFTGYRGLGCLLAIAFGGGVAAKVALGEARMWELVARFDNLADGCRWTSPSFFHVRKKVSDETLRILCQNRARRILARRVLASCDVRETAHA